MISTILDSSPNHTGAGHDPKPFLALLAAIFIVAAAILLQEELFSVLADPDTQVEMAESWGLTKAGRPRPGD